jgi:hypothetical protein
MYSIEKKNHRIGPTILFGPFKQILLAFSRLKIFTSLKLVSTEQLVYFFKTFFPLTLGWLRFFAIKMAWSSLKLLGIIISTQSMI